MKNRTIILLILTILFAGCSTQPQYHGTTLILAKNSPCLTCQVDLTKLK